MNKDSMKGKWIEYDHLDTNGGSILPHAKGHISILQGRLGRRLWRVTITIKFSIDVKGVTPTEPTSEVSLTFSPLQKLYLGKELSPLINEEFKKAIKEIYEICEEGLDVTLFNVLVKCLIR